ncbi:hypothetical protein OG762_45745 [Streptomyces sp. NBC_01136]|uniref:DUF6777 domain-containing protein n=1 Tax=Streptomyces sp. NBC_01136 TaxID=2903754 RepID=UPI003869997B|nr:hypothetical protein OG762_45745 [Streptomyces sp. NBC_01136]
MSVEPSSSEPSSSDRPKGPPSGPLAGPSQPDRPAPPDAETRPGGGGRSEPPGGPPGGEGPGGDEGPRHPWWKSAPRVAVVATAIVAAVALLLVFTRSDGTSNQRRGEVFLQSAGSTGADPFTESTAKEGASPTATPSLPATATGNVAQSVNGDAPGLYGGTRNVASCDVEKQITALKADPSKNAAFASVLGIQPAAVPGYLRPLTPVQLRADTRVTNHGYRNGSPTSYQAVLQAGTAVLVDDRGVPRVRCACGNPLTPPTAQKSTPRPVGHSWSGYRSSHVVVVAPASRPVKKFVVAGPKKGDWFTRNQGDHRGAHDKKTTPPPPPPPPPPSSSPEPSSPGKEQTPPKGQTSPGPGKPSRPSESGKASKSSESGKASKSSESGKASKSSESGKASKSSESGKASKSSSEPSSKESSKSQAPSSVPPSSQPAPPSSAPPPPSSAPENTAPQDSGSAPADTGQQQQQQPSGPAGS